MTQVPFNKFYSQPNASVSLLKTIGLGIADEAKVRSNLTRIEYYSILMRRFRLFLMLSLFSMLIVSCSKESMETFIYVPVEYKTLVFDSHYDSKIVSFKSTDDWSVTSKDIWINVTPKYGDAGDGLVTIAVDENNSESEKWIGFVSIISNDKEEVISIEQGKKTIIKPKTTLINADTEGDEIVLDIQSNVEYTTTVDVDAKDWVSCSSCPAGQRIIVLPNRQNFERTGEIYLSYGRDTTIVTINQDKANIQNYSTEYYVSGNGGNISVTSKANAHFEVSIKESDKEWICQLPNTRSQVSFTSEFKIIKNTSLVSRLGEIYFIYGDVIDTVFVHQNPKPVVDLDNKQLMFNEEGGNGEVTITHNTDYSIQLDNNVSWLTYSKRKISDNVDKLIVSVSSNPNITSRQALLNVSYDGEYTAINIEQKQKIDIIPSVSSVEAKPTADTYDIIIAHSIDYHIDLEKSVTWAQVSLDAEKNKLSIHVDNNESENARNAVIMLIGDGISKKIEIKQNPAIIELSSTNISLSSVENDFTFSISSNVPLTYSINEAAASWIIAKEILNTKMKFNASENNTREDRCGEISVLFGKLCKTISVSQDCHNILTYTTSDGNTISPSNSLKVISNTYIDGVGEITIPSTQSCIPSYCFEENNQLVSMSLPGRISSIGHCAFESCLRLEKIVLNEGLRDIGAGAFRGCKKLITINYPNSLVSIGLQAFMNCIMLSNAYIPSEMKSVPSGLFHGCTNLSDVIIPEGVETIEDYAFYNTKMNSLHIPTSLKETEDNSFQNCSIDNVYIQDLIAWINVKFSSGKYGWLNGSSPMSNKVKEIYINGEAVRELIIPEGVTGISHEKFLGGNITNVILPESIKSVGNSFTLSGDVYCKALTPPTFGGYSFRHKDYSKVTIYVPSEHYSDYKNSYCPNDCKFVAYDF